MCANAWCFLELHCSQVLQAIKILERVLTMPGGAVIHCCKAFLQGIHFLTVHLSIAWRFGSYCRQQLQQGVKGSQVYIIILPGVFGYPLLI
jgi:hypothetical protein